MSPVAGWGRTPSDIVAEIEMVRTNFVGGFFTVEGDADERFFRPRLKKSAYIVNAGGKRNVEQVLQIVDRDAKLSRLAIVGVVDEDYDWFTGHAVGSDNIVKIDPRDLEGLLVRCSSLEAALAEFGDQGAIEAFEATSGLSLREAICSRARLFGQIRMVNDVGPQVCLRALKPARFCDVSTWTYDEAEILAEAVRLGVSTTEASLKSMIATLPSPTPWHVVRGHDLIDILVGGLKGVLGGRSVGEREIERLLRQALPMDELVDTAFYRNLTRWQDVHASRFL